MQINTLKQIKYFFRLRIKNLKKEKMENKLTKACDLSRKEIVTNKTIAMLPRPSNGPRGCNIFLILIFRLIILFQIFSQS